MRIRSNLNGKINSMNRTEGRRRIITSLYAGSPRQRFSPKNGTFLHRCTAIHIEDTQLSSEIRHAAVYGEVPFINICVLRGFVYCETCFVSFIKR